MPGVFRLVQRLSPLLPPWARAAIRRRVSLVKYDQHVRRLADPFAAQGDQVEVPGSPCTLGILREPFHYHKVFVLACRELGVSYRLIDLAASDWIARVRNSGCDAFLVWPPAALTVWKEMFDDRLRAMAEMGLVVVPGERETWLYENKRRTHDWLTANDIPHPHTWVFYDEDEAMTFAAEATLPVVVKTNTGASAKGVWILTSRRSLRALIRRAFRSGLVARRRDPRDRQWGSVLLQEFLPEVREWRMVRIADSYFGHPKGRVGQFHSGSGAVAWDEPPPALLDLLHDVTSKGGFTSMNVDIFETTDGRYLVNELHTVFGASYSVDQARRDGVAGRYVREGDSGGWRFEPGDFARNACANLRVHHLLTETLGVKVSHRWWEGP